ncbi:Drebrin-like protein [Rhynchospora pubera]|uniref:Drebrin-like protein n=1 Tax=Rhynchospora pubera TaxID=906938 RepID=A0AAV8DM02_9POAL|nr:Drebrin-like protein [Rhynchospora pubera]
MEDPDPKLKKVGTGEGKKSVEKSTERIRKKGKERKGKGLGWVGLFFVSYRFVRHKNKKKKKKGEQEREKRKEKREMASASLALAAMKMIAAPSFLPSSCTPNTRSPTTTPTPTTPRSPSLSFSQQQSQELKAFIPSQSQFQFLPNPNPNPNPVLIDVQVQDSRGPGDDSVLFSFGIAEQCTRHEQILRYLMSGSSTPSAPDHLSNLSHLLGFHPCHQPLTPQDRRLLLLLASNTTTTMDQDQADSFARFLSRMSASSLLSVDPVGRILFSGSPAEMKDLLSILAEFDLPFTHTHTSPSPPAPSKLSLLVPYFDRTRFHAKAADKDSLLHFPTQTVAPSKRTKSQQKKQQKKHTSYNRDIFQKNYFHTCESLLSLLLDKSSTSTGRAAGTSTTILSLRKLGPEISHILTSFSIGIAGTGLAVLLSVACKMAGPGARVPLSAARVFNTGFGLGLFWLSWAVNGLRDTIVQVFKGSSKLKIKDDQMTLEVERSMKDVLFRAGALVALAALRFA